VDCRKVGETAAAHGVVLYELSPQAASLEEAFMELTRDDVEFRSEDSRHLVVAGK